MPDTPAPMTATVERGRSGIAGNDAMMPSLMLFSIALFVLGLWAVLSVINARRPARNFALIGISWMSAWVTTELAPHLVVLGTIAAGALVGLGGLHHTVGRIGPPGGVLPRPGALPPDRAALQNRPGIPP